MSQTSARLSLPYIQEAQAQKHVTHNEALARLDVLVQLTVQAFEATTPPISPSDGDVWAVGTGATGDWVGQDNDLACWSNGGWLFITPVVGWLAVRGGELRVWSGTDWQVAQGTDLENVDGVGINTTSDATNRLSVAADATLLSHEGAGHQLKLNKATAGDTASLLFQTGFSGRAEMGTTGSDDFAIKASADGSAWFDALVARGTDGRVVLPRGAELEDGNAATPALAFSAEADTGLWRAEAQAIGIGTGGVERARVTENGMTLSGLLSGTAVTQSETDQTAGRVMKSGDFGLGRAIGLTAEDDLNGLLSTGFFFNPTAGNCPGNNYPMASAGALLNNRRTSGLWVQQFISYGATSVASRLRQFSRSFGSFGWTPWVELMHHGSMVGTVSQSEGVPTGAVLERGANANGDYVRFADGTQICTSKITISAAISTAFMGGFRTATQTWNFPAQFVAGSPPVVTGAALEGTAFGVTFEGATTTGQTGWNATSISTQGAASRIVNLSATGRWF